MGMGVMYRHLKSLFTGLVGLVHIIPSKVKTHVGVCQL